MIVYKHHQKTIFHWEQLHIVNLSELVLLACTAVQVHGDQCAENSCIHRLLMINNLVLVYFRRVKACQISLQHTMMAASHARKFSSWRQVHDGWLTWCKAQRQWFLIVHGSWSVAVGTWCSVSRDTSRDCLLWESTGLSSSSSSFSHVTIVVESSCIMSWSSLWQCRLVPCSEQFLILTTCHAHRRKRPVRATVCDLLCASRCWLSTALCGQLLQ